MAYRVSARNSGTDASYTLTRVIQLVSSDNPPTNIAFPNLGTPPNTNNLSVNQGMAINFGVNNEVTRAFGLVSCASVCYVNPANMIGYVYHANAGHVAQNDFQNAIGAIHGTPGSTYIAYAHPNDTDNGYLRTINDFVNWGVPTGNIVEITNLLVPQFGINNHAQLGF